MTTKSINFSLSDVSIEKIREYGRSTLFSVIDKYEGKKILVMDPSLTNPLGTLIDGNIFKEHNIEKWFELSSNAIDLDFKDIFFLIRSNLETIPILANQIIRTSEKNQKKNRKQSLHILFVPDLSDLYLEKLNDLNVLGLVHSFHSVPIYLFPIDTDLISLERPGIFASLHSRDNALPLLEVADAFANFEYLTGGVINEVRTLGQGSRIVIDSLLKRRRDILAQKCLPLCPTTVTTKSEAEKKHGSNLTVSFDDGAISKHIQIPSSKGILPAGSPDDHNEGDTAPSTSSNGPPVRFAACAPPLFTPVNEKGERLVDEDGNEIAPHALPIDDVRLLLQSPISSSHQHVGSKNHTDVFYEGLGDDGQWRPECALAVVLDRHCDLLSTLCTPFTYEALLDAAFPIKSNGVIDVPSKYTGCAGKNNANDVNGAGNGVTAGNENELKRVIANSGDSLYADIRSKHVQTLGVFFSTKTRQIDQIYKQKEALISLQDINNFMPRFKEAQQTHISVGIHLSLASFISSRLSIAHAERWLGLEDRLLSGGISSVDFISKLEDEVDALPNLPLSLQPAPLGNPLFACMKLLSICALTGNLKQRQLQHFKRFIHSTWGVTGVSLLLSMSKCGLIPLDVSASTVFGTIRDGFSLLSPIEQQQQVSSAVSGEESNSAELADVSFVYSGMAPPSIRVVQKLLESVCSNVSSPTLPANFQMASNPLHSASWKPHSHLVNLLGSIFEVSQTPAVPSLSVARSNSVDANGQKLNESEDINSGEKFAAVANAIGSSNLSTLNWQHPSIGAEIPSSISGPVVVLVTYVGGVTLGEMAAWRFLNQQSALAAAASNGSRRPVRFVILTSEVLSLQKGCLLQSLLASTP